jgi:hypothetical protein
MAFIDFSTSNEFTKLAGSLFACRSPVSSCVPHVSSCSEVIMVVT